MRSPTITRTGSSASATSWCASAGGGRWGSISASPRPGCWSRAAGVAAGVFPLPCLAALLSVPLLVASGRCAVHTYESPREFIPAVRNIVSCYMVAVLLFTCGVLWAGGR